uniref:G-protein coupled receptors family 1 profile domain-containing protein n=1 Tax=Parascaris equorum TaxID=6256 RepID=A0A914RPQ2_PAREQ
MPFSIYLSVNALHWHLPLSVCYFYCVLDVAASTCSIVHLVLISVDRWVLRNFCCSQTSQLRCFLKFFPGTTLNTKTRHFLVSEHHCGIYSPIYMFCSSIFAFYLPCIVMILTYGYIFYTLRRRLQAIQLQVNTGYVQIMKCLHRVVENSCFPLRKLYRIFLKHFKLIRHSQTRNKSRNSFQMSNFQEMAGGQFVGFGADVGNIANSAMQTVIGVAPSNRQAISWEKPLLKKIEETAAEHASSLNESEREQVHLSPLIIITGLLGIAASFVFIMQVKRRMRRLSNIISEWERPSRSSLSHMYSLARRESVYIARRKLAGLKDWALDLLAKLRSKQGMAIRRETRATKLVAIVMGKF